HALGVRTPSARTQASRGIALSPTPSGARIVGLVVGSLGKPCASPIRDGSKQLPTRRSKMLRVIAVFAVIVVFTESGSAADLVSMKLCPTRDYDSAARDCAAGKGWEGKSIRIDPTKIGSVQFLTTVKTSTDEDMYHVWIFGQSSSKVLFYDSTTKILREAE